MSYLNSFFSLIKYHLSLLFIGVLVASSFIANGSQSSNKLPKKINDSKVKEIEKYYYRLTGMLPDKNKNELNQIINKSMDGNYLNENDLFNNLFLVPEFTENRLASFISGLSNLDKSKFEITDDYQISLLLSIVQNSDFRDLFQKPYVIKNKSTQQNERTNNDFQVGKNSHSLLEFTKQFELISSNPSAIDSNNRESTDDVFFYGLFSTRGFSSRFVKNGTNRLAIKAIFEIYLCSSLDSIKDNTLDDFYNGVDIDPKPSDHVNKYMTNCRACHSVTDPMRGAFAFMGFNSNNNTPFLSNKVDEKYFKNEKNNPQGFLTLDDSWEIPLDSETNMKRFGWRNQLSGRGLLAYSSVIVNSEQFQRCMTQNMLRIFCDKSNEDIQNLIPLNEFEELSGSLRESNYRLKDFIKNTVKSSLCN